MSTQIGKRIKIRNIPIQSLVLDPDHPRFYHMKFSHNLDQVTDADLEKEIMADDDYFSLLDQVKGDGVREPIWVVRLKGGKYRVIEGNRRAIALRDLVRRGVAPPKGMRFDMVKAHIFSGNTSETLPAVQRATLQTGRKQLSQFSYAANIYNLKTINKMTIEEIAALLQVSERKLRRVIDDFMMYIEFSRLKKDQDPTEFSYFAEAPKNVRDRFFKTEKDRKQFYELIVPNKEGHTRIKTVATRGGLRDFSKIIPNEKILNNFLKDKSMSVQEALSYLHRSPKKRALEQSKTRVSR